MSKATKKSASVKPTGSNTSTKRKRKAPAAPAGAPTKAKAAVSKSKTGKITFRLEPKNKHAKTNKKYCMVITNDIECERFAVGTPLYKKVHTCVSCRRYNDVHSLAKEMYWQPRQTSKAATRKRKVTESNHQPEPTNRQKKVTEKASVATATANDTLSIGIEDFFSGSFPPNMIVMKEDKKRMGKSHYYCRVNQCTCQGRKSNFGLCNYHFSEVEEYRMKLKLEEVFQFPENFDEQINDIDGTKNVSHSVIILL